MCACTAFGSVIAHQQVQQWVLQTTSGPHIIERALSPYYGSSFWHEAAWNRKFGVNNDIYPSDICLPARRFVIDTDTRRRVGCVVVSRLPGFASAWIQNVCSPAVPLTAYRVTGDCIPVVASSSTPSDACERMHMNQVSRHPRPSVSSMRASYRDLENRTSWANRILRPRGHLS